MVYTTCLVGGLGEWINVKWSWLICPYFANVFVSFNPETFMRWRQSRIFWCCGWGVGIFINTFYSNILL
jgi:hypothetical protein